MVKLKVFVMIIRRGEMSDFKEIFRILNSAPELRHVYAGKNYNKEWAMDMIKDHKLYVCLVAEDKGKIAGFLTAELWRDEKYSFILDLYVAPKYRRNGVATMLYKEHESICKKARIKIILTSVLVANKKMQKFLNKFRYEKGTKVYYYEKELK